MELEQELMVMPVFQHRLPSELESRLRFKAYRAEMRGAALRWRVAMLNPRMTHPVIRRRRALLATAVTYRDLSRPLAKMLVNHG